MLRMNGWNRATVWGTSGVAAAVLALTACSASSGDDDTEGAGKGEKSGAATAPRHQTKECFQKAGSLRARIMH
ncbi:hypothetical protein SSPO_095490 [Streptomyces antimycoticus]|uniref:Lipoprotein n=1 Tax=Streptomyces antimycoticus TaxID=68175 RepID=A0A499VBD0_9ACTN|nr:hypothetical protein SSPO_095490 [Streptomyces antimycoticus]